MSFARPQPVPRTPTLPQGDAVAAYPTYLEAQQAVDYLSDQKFPVQGVTIVGTDLRMVERVTGRLSYGRVAMAGAGSGAWFGLFVGLLLSMFGGVGVGNGVVFIGVALGAGFGLLFSVLSYALARGKRDFTSQSQIVATTYAILCDPASAGEARSLLMRSPGGLGKARSEATAAPVPYGAPAPVAAPSVPRAPDPRWTTPTGEPRYGAMRPDTPPAQPTQPAPPVAPTPAQPAQPAPPATPAPSAPPTPTQPAPPIAPTPPTDPTSTTPPAPTAPSNPYAPPRADD